MEVVNVARKENAKQRRERKERERAERAAYESGARPAAAPRGLTARRKKQAERSAAQKEFSGFLNRPAAESNKMNAIALQIEVEALHAIAHERYSALLAQGTPNVATVLFENEFAGLNPAENNINANRATAAKLRAWLKRKDASLKRARRQQKKTLQWARKNGYTGGAEGLADMFDFMSRYAEQHGGQYNYKLFPAVYSAVIDKGGTMQDVFDEYEKRERAQYEKDMRNTTFGGAPLEIVGGVRTPNASELLASYQKSLSTPGTRQAKKTKSKRRKRR